MDKRFDQFTYAAPTGTRLLLHADPTDGSIRKAPVSEFTGGGGSNNFIQVVSSIVNSEAGIFKAVISFAIPGNTLDADGKGFEFYIMASTSGGSSTRQITAQFQSSSITMIDSTFAFYMYASGTFLRRSSSTGIITGLGIRSGSSYQTTFLQVNSVDYTTTNNFNINIYSTNDDEISVQTAYLKKLNY